jgi:hypothetical protein
VTRQSTNRRNRVVFYSLLALILSLGAWPELLKSGTAIGAPASDGRVATTDQVASDDYADSYGEMASFDELGTYEEETTDDQAESLDKLSTPPVLTVNRNATFQTWTGWEATAHIYGDDTNASWFPAVRNQVVYRAALLGVSQLRLEVRDEIDHGNGTYDWTEFDRKINLVVKPLRDELLLRRGETLKVNVCNVSFGSGAVPNHPHLNPTVFGNYAAAAVDRAARIHGLSVSYFEICLEPDNVGGNTVFNTPLRMSNAINAARSALNARGYSYVKLIAPSCVNTQTALNWMQTLQSSYSSAFSKINLLSYHRYTSSTQSVITSIGELARTSGKQSGMTEYLSATCDHLYRDLTWGRASLWQRFGLASNSQNTNASYANAGLFKINAANTNNVVVSDGTSTPAVRQYFANIRPGAVRCTVTSSPAGYNATAWNGPNSNFVLIVPTINGSFQVAGLLAGNYEISWVRNNLNAAGPIVTAVNGRITVNPPSGASCITIKKV